MKIRPIFTLDYEIDGDGSGSPDELVIGPTEELLDILEEVGAKLTIFAEVAEIIRFQSYAETTGSDPFGFERITDQLRRAISAGHDVQLHLHPSFWAADFTDGKWRQDWDRYDLARLPLPDASEMIRISKNFLEELLRPVDPNYTCYAFRAGNWAMMPSGNIAQALIENGINVDSSVFKYGHRSGLVNFDYGDATSEILQWRADPSNICHAKPDSPLWEFPIYSENRSLLAFVNLARLHMMLSRIRKRQRYADRSSLAATASSRQEIVRKLFSRYAWKADFNVCSSNQLIRAMETAHARHCRRDEDVPFVMIGHSKLQTRYSTGEFKKLAKYLRQNVDRFRPAVFRDLLPLEKALQN